MVSAWNNRISVPAFGGNAPAATLLQVLALLLVPVAVIWIGAFTLWRAADMRQVSEALFQSAMRLVRPQDIATEGLTTIAQAVRSEVDLLVGGVEHAAAHLARDQEHAGDADGTERLEPVGVRAEHGHRGRECCDGDAHLKPGIKPKGPPHALHPGAEQLAAKSQ